MTDSAPTLFDALRPEANSTGWTALEELWDAYASCRARGAAPLVAAVSVAAGADRLGHAFAVGYPAALERLVPGVALPPALCVTEDGGNSPKALRTTLEPAPSGFLLRGAKSFVTFGSLAKDLVIAAREGTRPDGLPNVAVVRIPRERRGVVVDELPPTPFVPEVVHARLTLDDVEVYDEEKLPGDGYLGYVKPFRTIEDIHVVAATLGYVVGWAQRVGGSAELLSACAADLACLATLAEGEPLDPGVHIALHGCYARVASTLEGDDFGRLLQAADPEERDRWTRDRKLLSIAQKAREARFASARRALGFDR